jgi:hypothetical protein
VLHAQNSLFIRDSKSFDFIYKIRVIQRKLSHLRRKLWREAGPPPDLATRLFSERIIYLVGLLIENIHCSTRRMHLLGNWHQQGSRTLLVCVAAGVSCKRLDTARKRRAYSSTCLLL